MFKCKMTKEQMIDTILEEFNTVIKDYDRALECEVNENFKERNHGRYIAMMDLLYKLDIREV